MVFAAPIFLVSQTKALSAFYAANREPLLRLGFGATIAWLSLRLLSKSYECSQLAEGAAQATRAHAQLLSRFSSDPWLGATSAMVAAAAPGARAAALGAALSAAARDAAEGAAAEGAAKAREAPSWLPASGALERARATQTAAVGEGGAGGGGGASAAAAGGAQGAALAQDAPPRRLI